jgi:DNA invertase Pin-like site-specific DNA recombinase
MANGKFVSYLRVSTSKQGHDGLGVEAQRSAVAAYLNGGSWTLVEEFVEVESGRRNDRPKLAAALAACRLHRATLVIAKLDRLARNAHFLLGLKEAGIAFVACDMPDANALTIGIMALVAQQEAEAISARTKAALAAAKQRGTKLGTARNATQDGIAKGAARSAVVRAATSAERAAQVIGTINEIRAGGVRSASGIAAELNRRGVPTARVMKENETAGRWQAVQVQRVIGRAGHPNPANAA